MADPDPMGGGDPVALALSDAQRRYLRCTFGYCKSGREDDLRTHPEHPNAGKWRAAAGAYERLVAGIDAGEIVPDHQVRHLVCELAEATDREEEYERIVFEHDALAALREQIGAGQ